ncbi:MAG TPA: VTT domain-containing protein [Acidobacteriota bacterium]|nr:VTT domain-containing protein [Acidobacteriota bacterium]
MEKAKRFPFNLLRALYDWVLSFADRPGGVWALLLIAFAESSFFPIPPDVLLIALAIGAPMRSWWFALVCSIGSVAGAAAGYLIGLEFYSLIGRPIIEFYSAAERYDQVKALYDRWDAVAVGVAGFTPIPFKVFTISAGAFQVHFWTFLAAAAASRSARFFLVAGLIRWFGPGIRELVDRYFNLLTILFVILLVGGFVVLKYVI